MKRITLVALLLFAASGAFAATAPPSALNYQGVLRDASDRPLDGTFDMVFRYFDAAEGGDEIMVDTHAGVVVSGGLFDVRLGGVTGDGDGVATDGSGPGRYAYLPKVFRDYPQVYLELEIEGEILAPRTEIASAANALNARYVMGMEIASNAPLDLYVDAAMGDDDNSGFSPGSAKRTIQAAVGRIPPILGGEVTVYIANGTYSESILLDRRFRTGLFMLNFVGNPGAPENVVLDGQGVFDEGFMVIGDLVTISGITMTNYREQGFELNGGIAWLNSCRVVGNGDTPGTGSGAIEVHLMGNLSIENCTIADNLASGLEITNSTVEISNSFVLDNGGHGIFACDSSDVEGDDFVHIRRNGGTGAEICRNSSIDFNQSGGLLIDGNTGGSMRASYQSTVSGYGSGSTGSCVAADTTSMCDP